MRFRGRVRRLAAYGRRRAAGRGAAAGQRQSSVLPTGPPRTSNETAIDRGRTIAKRQRPAGRLPWREGGGD